MRRVFTLWLILAAVLVLAACVRLPKPPIIPDPEKLSFLFFYVDG